MQVTDVRIRKLSDEGKMRGIVSVTFDDSFVVHDIKIIEGQNGLFIAMPSRKIGEGEFRDIAHPINSNTRNIIQEHILEAYEEAKEKADLEESNVEQEGFESYSEDEEVESLSSEEAEGDGEVTSSDWSEESDDENISGDFTSL